MFNPQPKPKRRKKVKNPLKPNFDSFVKYKDGTDNTPEKILQSNVEEYLKYFDDIKLIRIPDTLYRVVKTSHIIPEHVKIRIFDYIKGIPDLILLKRASDFFCVAVCIELKSATGRPSKKQKDFAGIVPVHLVRNFERAKLIIDRLHNFKGIKNAV